MTRAEKIRRQIPGAADDLITCLAARPAEEVALIVAALRQARRDGVAHEKQLRAQRKADARKYNHYDESQLAGRNLRVLDATGRRAAADLAALESLAGFTRHAGDLMAMAVAQLRARDYSDEEIGRALGITRQAVGQRFGRKGPFTPDARVAGQP